MVENRRGDLINFMNMEFLSIPENIGLSRVTVASFAAQLDLTVNEMEELKVAVSEAVSNSIIHGYNNKPTGKVWIFVALYEYVLNIEIKDEGVGIEDVDKAMEAAYSTDPERMGLGFVFMKSFMDEIKVESETGSGTAVKMSKEVAARKKASHERS